MFKVGESNFDFDTDFDSDSDSACLASVGKGGPCPSSTLVGEPAESQEPVLEGRTLRLSKGPFVVTQSKPYLLYSKLLLALNWLDTSIYSAAQMAHSTPDLQPI